MRSCSPSARLQRFAGSLTMLLCLLVVGATLLSGCADASLEDERAEQLARTCRSIGERRLAGELDRARLPTEVRFRTALDNVEGRQSGAATLRGLCRPRAVDATP